MIEPTSKYHPFKAITAATTPTSKIIKPNLKPHAPAFLAEGLDPPVTSEMIPATIPISYNMPLTIKANIRLFFIAHVFQITEMSKANRV